MAEYTPTGKQGGTKQGNGSLAEGGLTGAASQAASGLMDQVKTRASSQVAAQQAKAADGLGTVAGALRKAGDELRSNNEGLASYADMAVKELEHISTRIREKSPGEYVSDLENFARSRPAAFVGGSFLLGLGLARFLKSTQPQRPQSYQRYDAGRRGSAGGYRGYDVRSGGPGQWPESTGSRTPPASTGRPASASGLGGNTGTSPSTAGGNTGMQGLSGTSSTGLSDDIGGAGSGTERGSTTSEETQAASRAGKTAANQGRGTGDRS